MTATTVSAVAAPTKRRLRDVMADLETITAEVEAIIATYPPDHPARRELARQKRQAEL
jgi:hypothetical protein